MRDTCGLLIAGQGAARGDRRATGEERDWPDSPASPLLFLTTRTRSFPREDRRLCKLAE
jgi:hypothetical protein